MHWIEADGPGAGSGGAVNEVRQIGKIADAPVPRRAQSEELKCEAPKPPAVPKRRRQKGTRGGNYQSTLGDRRPAMARQQPQAVAAGCQGHLDRDLGRVATDRPIQTVAGRGLDLPAKPLYGCRPSSERHGQRGIAVAVHEHGWQDRIVRRGQQPCDKRPGSGFRYLPRFAALAAIPDLDAEIATQRLERASERHVPPFRSAKNQATNQPGSASQGRCCAIAGCVLRSILPATSMVSAFTGSSDSRATSVSLLFSASRQDTRRISPCRSSCLASASAIPAKRGTISECRSASSSS